MNRAPAPGDPQHPAQLRADRPGESQPSRKRPLLLLLSIGMLLAWSIFLGLLAWRG
jgi:hypothetical protein